MSIDLAQIPDETIRHEWAHFRGFGWDDEKIAVRLGFAEHTPAQWERNTPTTTKGSRAHREARRREVRILTAEGWSASEIADALGCSLDIVHKDRKRMGLRQIGLNSATCPVCGQKVLATAVLATHPDLAGVQCPMSGQPARAAS